MTAETADMPASPATPLVACHDCGTLHRLGPMRGGEGAYCRRCGASLAVAHDNSIESALALNIAAGALFITANTLPFMTFELEGRELTTRLWEGAVALTHAGMWPLGLLVMMVGTVVPGVKIAIATVVLGALRLGMRGRWLATGLRWMVILRPWSMIEVFLLGVIVGYVKLIELARLELHAGLWSLAMLIPLLAAAEFVFNRQEAWDMLEPQRRDGASPRHLVACHDCGQLNDDRTAHGQCSRCGSALHRRKNDAMAGTLALVIAAIILYVPANLLPVMRVVSFGQSEPDTIMSGVFTLLEHGMVPVALLVLFASILVPVLKLAVLTYLLITVRFGGRRSARDRTKLYRIIEVIGPWSMVDVFMIALLAALVDLGQIATIEPGPGALAFASVVILTMFAAMRFDPRLIWDAEDLGENDRV
ncbi:MAG: paraquat-inducible protein A [Geminicoccaceae bacterium]|nr:paraquat-inducible protein A [Geminicoccaceae bacterium]